LRQVRREGPSHRLRLAARWIVQDPLATAHIPVRCSPQTGARAPARVGRKRLRYLNAAGLCGVYVEFASKQQVVEPQRLALVFSD